MAQAAPAPLANDAGKKGPLLQSEAPAWSKVKGIIDGLVKLQKESPETGKVDAVLLQRIALTIAKLAAQNPAILAKLNQERLQPFHTLAEKLLFYYKTDDTRSLLTPEQLADLAKAEAVPKNELVEQLARYKVWAQLMYSADCRLDTGVALGKEEPCDTTEHVMARLKDYFPNYQLLEVKGKDGAPNTWNCHFECTPAFFVCYSEKDKEVVVVVRGSTTARDWGVDLLGAGEPFDRNAPKGKAYHCHEGMGQAAEQVGEQVYADVKAWHDKGYRITVAGHSLGAGVAGLLTAYFLNRDIGPDRLKCWAYEPPACMHAELADMCAKESPLLPGCGIVTSLVNGDDVVCRVSARAVGQVLDTLAALEVPPAAREAASPYEQGLIEKLGKLIEEALKQATESSEAANVNMGQGLTLILGGLKKENNDQKEEGGNKLLGALGGTANAVLWPVKQLGGLVGRVFKGNGVADADAGFDKKYKARVPGRVVLAYPRATDADCKLAIVDCHHPAITTLQVGKHMLFDHHIYNWQFKFHK